MRGRGAMGTFFKQKKKKYIIYYSYGVGFELRQLCAIYPDRRPDYTTTPIRGTT